VSAPRLLVAGDGSGITGFSRVIRSILEPLSSGFQIHHLAVGYFGDPHGYPWPLYPAVIGGDDFGVKRVRNLAEVLKPDLIFLVSTFETVGNYLEELRPLRAGAKVVAYCPVESGPIDPGVVARLAGLSKLVLYTRSAKQIFLDALARSALPQPQAARLADPCVVPHGVDTTHFYPMSPGSAGPAEARRAAKRQLFGDDEELCNSFIVLNANRNQPRKRIDVTMKGFAIFAAGKPNNVRLYLHMGIQDMGWNVITLAERYGITDRLILTNRSMTIPAVPDAELNLIYNACDVGLNTCSSEGWGLVSFEHGATRAAQILPRQAALEELWSGQAEMLEPALCVTEPGSLTDSYLITPEEVAKKLERLYRDPAYLDSLAALALVNARRPEYRWENIANRWGEVFSEVLNA
jgi:glycosyltransferase involved in cell wall biosynthesis